MEKAWHLAVLGLRGLIYIGLDRAKIKKRPLSEFYNIQSIIPSLGDRWARFISRFMNDLPYGNA